MIAQLEAGLGLKTIARAVGCHRQTVRNAMVEHGLDRWAYQLAARFGFAVEMEAEARRRQQRVVAELLAQGHSTTQVADLLKITPRAVTRLAGLDSG